MNGEAESKRNAHNPTEDRCRQVLKASLATNNVCIYNRIIITTMIIIIPFWMETMASFLCSALWKQTNLDILMLIETHRNWVEFLRLVVRVLCILSTPFTDTAAMHTQRLMVGFCALYCIWRHRRSHTENKISLDCTPSYSLEFTLNALRQFVCHL